MGRLRLGWSLEDIVDKPDKVIGRSARPYNLGDQESIRTLAEKHGVPPKRAYERLKNGWTMDEALEITPRPFTNGKAKQVQIRNLTFRSHAKASEYFGISESAWRKRIKNGWSPEQAADLAPRPEKKKAPDG